MVKKLLCLAAVLAAPAAAQDQSGFLWRLKPEIGSKWTATASIHTEANERTPAPPGVAMPNQTLNSVTTITQELNADFDVVSRDSKGNLVIDLTYRSLSGTFSLSMNGQPMNVPEQAQMQSSLDTALNDFPQTTLRLLVSPLGQLLYIGGAQVMAQKVDDVLLEIPAATRPAIKSLLVNLYSKNTFQGMFSSGDKLPAQPIRVGQSVAYIRNQSDSAGTGHGMQVTELLQKRSGGIAYFVDSGKTSLAMHNMEAKLAKGSRVNMDLGGSLHGTTQVDEVTGLVRDSSAVIRMQGIDHLRVSNSKEVLTVPTVLTISAHTTVEPRVQVPGIIQLP
jgi:hypothetical protein